MNFVWLDPAPWIAGFGVLTPAGYGVDTLLSSRQPGRPPGDEITLEIGAPLGDSASGYRRVDRYGMLGLAAARGALSAAGVDPPPTVDASWGVMFGSSLGCWESCARFHDDLRHRPIAEMSPALFARTAASAVTRDVSLAFHLGGPTETFVSGWTAGVDAVVAAGGTLADGGAERMLAGGIEAPGHRFRRLHVTARRRAGSEWLPGSLAEAAACVVLAMNEVPGAHRLRSYWRGHDSQERWSLGEALSALQPLAIRTIIVANSTPPGLLARWRDESGGRPIIDLPGRSGELGAAGSITAIAMTCSLDGDSALVVARGTEGDIKALALSR